MYRQVQSDPNQDMKDEPTTYQFNRLISVELWNMVKELTVLAK